MDRKDRRARKMTVYRGERISPGVAIGRVHIFNDIIHSNLPVTIVPPSMVFGEKDRLVKAIAEANREIEVIAGKVHAEMGFDESSIFQTHLLILNDKRFVGQMLRLVEEDRYAAESAVRTVVEEWEKTFSDSPAPQLQMKVFDILDIGKRLISKLSFGGPSEIRDEPVPSQLGRGRSVVLVARILLPSMTAFIDPRKVRGIVTELGNKASHSAVIARSLGIPAVFGIQNLVHRLGGGEEIIVDGSTGNVYIDPDPAVKKEFESFRKQFFVFKRRLDHLTALPAVTRDGTGVELFANVGASADAESAVKYNTSGVGLYRTEMPFLVRNEFPDEETQYAVYRRVVEKMDGRPVSIRTLDLGGDKMPTFFSMPKEDNPNLGWRAIRVFIDHPEFFKVQLRAILRASAHGDVRIILPMISDITEVRITRRILAEAKRELRARGVPFSDSVKLGIMIEVPSAVILAEHLIREVDFFSVGTNDLIQYTLAVDRNSEKAARYLEPLNPAVIRMLQQLVGVVDRAGKYLTLCGEVASDPLYIPLLIGMGYRRLSVNPLAVNMVKDIVRSIALDDARRALERVMRRKTAGEIRHYMERFVSGLETTGSYAFALRKPRSRGRRGGGRGRPAR